MSAWNDTTVAAHNARIAAGKRGVTPLPMVKASAKVTCDMTPRPTTDEDKLNKTERAYLAYLRCLGDKWIGVQNITFKLANDCRFTPDFAAIDHKGIMRLIDVKGFQREDALIKIKVAARAFPFLRFVIVKKDGAGWAHEDVLP